jgi:hypothetical protein
MVMGMVVLHRVPSARRLNLKVTIFQEDARRAVESRNRIKKAALPLAYFTRDRSTVPYNLVWTSYNE